jgi:hypothetical protein
MARNNTKRKASGKKVYSIIVDGETEVWYLQLEFWYLLHFKETGKYYASS